MKDFKFDKTISGFKKIWLSMPYFGNLSTINTAVSFGNFLICLSDSFNIKS